MGYRESEVWWLINWKEIARKWSWTVRGSVHTSPWSYWRKQQISFRKIGDAGEIRTGLLLNTRLAWLLHQVCQSSLKEYVNITVCGVLKDLLPLMDTDGMLCHSDSFRYRQILKVLATTRASTGQWELFSALWHRTEQPTSVGGCTDVHKDVAFRKAVETKTHDVAKSGHKFRYAIVVTYRYAIVVTYR